MAIKPAPIVRQKANLSPEQMRAAIRKIERRIADLEAFEPQHVQDLSDPVVNSLHTKLADTIVDIFPHDTLDYSRFAPTALYQGPLYMGRPLPLNDVQLGFVRGKAENLANLRTIIELFQEKLAEGGESPEGRARRAFGDLGLHPNIARATAKLFEDGHYANAVEDACKVLDMLVQLRAMRPDINGTNLMRTVFSVKAPILKFNELQTESEKSEQEGMMHLYEGAMMALRNPRAHGVTEDHPERAIEYLSFVSMLANALDRTTNAYSADNGRAGMWQSIAQRLSCRFISRLKTARQIFLRSQPTQFSTNFQLYFIACFYIDTNKTGFLNGF